MKSLKIVLMLSAVLVIGISFTACGGPKSAAAMKVEKGIDDLKAAVDANPTDCAKMAAAIKAPVSDIAMGMKETKEKNEKLPAGTKMKMAGLTTTVQKMGPCSKSPEMQQLFQGLLMSMSGQ